MGKLSRGRRERGYILLDALAALSIALIGLAVFLGGLAGAARIAARQSDRVHSTLEQRSADAKAQIDNFPDT